MKKSVKTAIISLAMCALLVGSAVPVFAASVPVNVTGNVTQNFMDNTPMKELKSSASEIRLMDGQSMDFYISGTSLQESDAEKMRYYSEDSNVATVQYIGFDAVKGFQFRITANLKGTAQKTVRTGEATTRINVDHRGGGGGSCDVIVSKKGDLGLSTTDVMMIGKTGGSVYDFYVLGVNDASKIKVTSNNTSVATVQLIDANDPRGAKYRITAQPNNSGAIKGPMGTKFAYIDVEYNGQKRDIRVQNYSVAGSVMVDTTSYTMPTQGGKYQIGVTIRDGDGNKLSAEEVKWLLDTDVLQVSDSRSGSIVDLQQLSNGNFQITAKKAGTTYILFEINGCHASLRVDVKDGASAGGAATRNTSYWSFAGDFTKPVRFAAQSHYYYNADGSWNEQAIINEAVALGQQMRMKYTSDLLPLTPNNQVNRGGWYTPTNMVVDAQFRTDSYRNGKDYQETGFATHADYSAYYKQKEIFDSIKQVADNARDGSRFGTESNTRFNVCIMDISKEVPNAGTYSLFVPYG